MLAKTPKYTGGRRRRPCYARQKPYCNLQTTGQSAARKWFSREMSMSSTTGFDITAPILSDADAILRWMIDTDTILYPEPLALRRRWSGSATATTRHSSAMTDTMKFLVKNVLQHAISSKKFTAMQLSKLEIGAREDFHLRLAPAVGAERLYNMKLYNHDDSIFELIRHSHIVRL